MLKQIGVDRNGFPIFEAKAPKKECNHDWVDYDGPTSVQPGPNDSTRKESCTKCMKVQFKRNEPRTRRSSWPDDDDHESNSDAY